MKNAHIYVTVIALAIFIGSALTSVQKIRAKSDYYTTCRAIGSFSEAQKDLGLYQMAPKQYKQFSHLDANHDGVACEILK